MAIGGMTPEEWIFAVALLAVAIGITYVVAISWLNRGPKPLTALVCGATGVGKSTLINTMIGREAALVGIGKPVTQNTYYVISQEKGMAFYDSKGLEVEDASKTYLLLLSDVFRLRFHHKPRRQIDGVLICVAEPSQRIETAHDEIANLCEDLCIPYGFVLTKSDENQVFCDLVRSTFPGATFIHSVRALPLEIGNISLPVQGVSELPALLAGFASRDAQEGVVRARQGKKIRLIADLAHDLAATNADVAWALLARVTYTLLLPDPKMTWSVWLDTASSRVRRSLVPGFFQRHLLTKFDNAKIDGHLARRVFPRILRKFAKPGTQSSDLGMDYVVAEALDQCETERPYRSRF